MKLGTKLIITHPNGNFLKKMLTKD